MNNKTTSPPEGLSGRERPTLVPHSSQLLAGPRRYGAIMVPFFLSCLSSPHLAGEISSPVLKLSGASTPVSSLSAGDPLSPSLPLPRQGRNDQTSAPPHRAPVLMLPAGVSEEVSSFSTLRVQHPLFPQRPCSGTINAALFCLWFQPVTLHCHSPSCHFSSSTSM